MTRPEFRDVVRVEWESRVRWERETREVREHRAAERDGGQTGLGFCERGGSGKLGLGFWEGRKG